MKLEGALHLCRLYNEHFKDPRNTYAMASEDSVTFEVTEENFSVRIYVDDKLVEEVNDFEEFDEITNYIAENYGTYLLEKFIPAQEYRGRLMPIKSATRRA